MTKQENLKAEIQATNTLLHEGIKFKAGVFRWTIKQSYLGTLLHISKVYAELLYDEERLKDSPVSGGYALVPENAKRMARIIAIAVLNSKWKIMLFAPILTAYFLWNVKPDKLLSLISVLLVLNNVADFTHSIRLIHALRMMKPKEILIEKPEKD